MATADEVIVQFEARIGKYEADLKRAAGTFERAVGAQRNQMERLERQIASSSSGIASQLRGLAGVFATAFSARAVQQLADGYTRFTNQLKVAGQEGAGLARTQESLFGIAQKYGVELESLGQLYSRGSQVANELNASQKDLIDFSEGVSAALKIQGSSATEASGALLQLSQLLATGTVRAEEFNSVNEGALPILQAVARNIDAAGGSVGKLKLLVNDGKISSQQFFRAFLAGLEQLKATAADSTLTIGNSFTVLNNALGKFIGETDQALSATQRISQAIIALSENLDTVVGAVAVLAALLLGRYVAGALGAARASTVVSTAMFAMQARAAGAATSMEALGLAGATAGRSLLAAFGGPVGLAITALTLGIGYMLEKQHEATAASEELTASIQGQTAQFAGLRQKQAEAAASAGTMSDKQRQLQSATANLTGEVGLLAQAWARVAAEAKAAAIEQARASALTAKANFEKAEAAFNSKFETAFRAAPKPFAERGLGNNLLPNDPKQALENAARAALPEAKLMQEAANNWRDAAKEWQGIQRTKLADFRAPPVAGPAGKEGGAKKTGAGKKRSGPSAEEIEQKHIEALSRTNQEELQARIQLSKDAVERASLMDDLLAAEFAERTAQINNDKQFTTEQKKAQIAALEVLYGKGRSTERELGPDGEIVAIATDGGLLGRQVAKELQDERNRQAQEMLQLEQDALDAQADITTNIKEKHRLETRALEISQEIQKALLEQAIANGQIAEADKARALLAQRQSAEKGALEKDQASPFRKFANDAQETAANLGNAVEQLGVDTLDRFNQGLVDAILNFTSLGDVGYAALKSLAGGLLEIALQQIEMQIINAILGKAAVTGTVAEAGVVAAAWAPAAALASLATLGANAAPASAALTGTVALSSGLAVLGGVPGLAGGGPVVGRGGPREDKQLIAASPGEYMIQEWAAKRLGRSALDQLNTTGQLPGVLPNGSTPAARGGGAGLGSFKSDMRSALAEAAKTMPPIELYPTLDSGTLLRAALATPGGRKAMFDFASQNRGAFRSNLQP